jgi:hypothetical protein
MRPHIEDYDEQNQLLIRQEIDQLYRWYGRLKSEADEALGSPAYWQYHRATERARDRYVHAVNQFEWE